MSFKRDGDDLDMLNMLKHKRVSTLLGEHIPEDEAKILSNGRLACTVCKRQPIFDTVIMLGKHRAGKRHVLELSRYLKHKELRDLKVLKKEQERLVKLESVAAAQLGTGVARTQELRGERTARRQTLNVTLPQQSELNSLTTVAEVKTGKSQVRRYLKTLHRKRSLDSIIQEKRDNYGNSNLDHRPQSQLRLSSCMLSGKMKPFMKNVNKGLSSSSSNSNLSLNLSGWIQDKEGKWVKDPNAEFDSDEDTPPKRD